MKSRLPNGQIMTGYYGVEGVMEQGWDNENDAIKAFEEDYDIDDGLFVIEIENDNWVIAY